MAKKNNTKKSSIGSNQPHSREVKDSAIDSKNPFEVPFIDPSYTSSPNIPHEDSSSNEELRVVCSEEPLYLIPKTELINFVIILEHTSSL